jgi:FixJ family two-component response regulator
LPGGAQSVARGDERVPNSGRESSRPGRVMTPRVNAAQERVFVVDDDPAVVRSLTRLLRAGGFEAAGFESPEEFLRRLPPDADGCAVLDFSMPGLDGLTLQRELQTRGHALPIVFLTGRGDIPTTVQAMKNGAVDFLSKPVDARILLAAVREALEVGQAGRQRRRETVEVHRRIESLTRREREVLEGIVAGKLNKQIAGTLGIREKTVKVHRGRVMEKMNVSSLAELVRQADLARGLPRKSVF